MATKDSFYRRLNTLGFLCCLSFLAYLIVCLQTPTTGHATPFSSLTRILLLASTVLFFLPALHNPEKGGQRFYSFLNILLLLCGIVMSISHLWLQSKADLISFEIQALCQQPFEHFMAQQQSVPDKMLLLFDLSGSCVAEKLGPFSISFPIQALLCFLLLFLLCWKILMNKPRSQGIFQ